MPRQFAKLFGPPNDQVLITLDRSVVAHHRDAPEVRIWFPTPDDNGVGYVALLFPTNAAGRVSARMAFEALDEVVAREQLAKARGRAIGPGGLQ